MSEIWHEGWPAGWDEKRVHALQDRFFDELEAVLRERSPDAHRGRVVLLSGGSDSLVLLTLVRHLWPADRVAALTMRGGDTVDFLSARAVAERFCVTQTVVDITGESILENLDMVRGRGYIRFPQLMFHICFELCLSQADVSGCLLYEGNGADVLLGSVGERVYRHAQKVAQAEGITLDEARTRAKVDHYHDRKSDRRGTHSATIFSDIARGLDAAPVTPFGDARLEWVTEVPYSVLSPLDKRFVKDGLRRRYGLDDIVERPRIPLQAGMGLDAEVADRLVERFGDLGETPDEITRALTA